MITKSEAIKNLLTVRTHSDLANLYNINMECQVNVGQDNGEIVEGDFKGRKWLGYTDGLTTWKPFRIPFKANTEPEYTDCEITWDLAEHAEAIGMTGWDWQNRCSRWVAFDFDAIIGHTEGLTPSQLEEVQKAAAAIDWITIRKSTSGNGIHLYVLLDNVPTQNHTEHAALARSILGLMSALTGFDFQSKIDTCGGNMWVWHRKMANTPGLTIIKQGTVLIDIPANWKDHVKVVTGHHRKNLPQDIGQVDVFEELAGTRPRVALDEDHKKLIEFLKEQSALWWWDQDHHMLVTHTIHLQDAHDSLNLKGYFKTSATGKEKGHDHNCFCFPMLRGAWSVRRYSPGAQEHESWVQDRAGWTSCYLNREPDLQTVCRAYGGLEDTSGGYIFREAGVATTAAGLLGVHLKLPPALTSRRTELKAHKDGRLIVKITHQAEDRGDEMQGWLAKQGNWIRIFNAPTAGPQDPDIGNYDDIVRHLVTEAHEDYGWMLKSDDKWRTEPITHVKVAMNSLGYNATEISGILGSSVFKCWQVVNKPFQPEYPGNREWNRNAAQLRFIPSSDLETLQYGTWTKILQHCGKGLDDAIQNNAWAKANGILSGADYLKCWVASLLQEPMEPLPYLYLYGNQNSGKSILHEAIALLLTKGYQRADAAITSTGSFNAELEGAIVCVIEETDLRSNKIAYNRIKDWVTSRELLIHPKGQTPYHVPNSTHWIQCANDFQSCPVFTGDTRITMCHVEDLDPLDIIPKKVLIPKLEKEAPDFLAALLKLELPDSNDRLNVPVIMTSDKAVAEHANLSELERFISEECVHDNGFAIKFSEFYDHFITSVEPENIHKWSKIRVGRELPPQFPKGRIRSTAQFYVGNVRWALRMTEKIGLKLALQGEYLDPVTQ